jgi:hypothetical protein
MATRLDLCFQCELGFCCSLQGVSRSNCRWVCGGFGTFLNCRIDEVAGGMCSSGAALGDCNASCFGINNYQAIQCCMPEITIDNDDVADPSVDPDYQDLLV